MTDIERKAMTIRFQNMRATCGLADGPGCHHAHRVGLTPSFTDFGCTEQCGCTNFEAGEPPEEVDAALQTTGIPVRITDKGREMLAKMKEEK